MCQPTVGFCCWQTSAQRRALKRVLSRKRRYWLWFLRRWKYLREKLANLLRNSFASCSRAQALHHGLKVENWRIKNCFLGRIAPRMLLKNLYGWSWGYVSFTELQDEDPCCPSITE
jgi:hypothetical protein